MQRSSKGFGLIGIACAVVFLIVTALVSASSQAEPRIVPSTDIENP